MRRIIALIAIGASLTAAPVVVGALQHSTKQFEQVIHLTNAPVQIDGGVCWVEHHDGWDEKLCRYFSE